MLEQTRADQRGTARIETSAFAPDEFRARGFETVRVDRLGKGERPRGALRIVGPTRGRREQEAPDSLGPAQGETKRRRSTQAEPSRDDRFALTRHPLEVVDQAFEFVSLRLGRCLAARMAASVVQHDPMRTAQDLRLRTEIPRASPEAM